MWALNQPAEPQGVLLSSLKTESWLIDFCESSRLFLGLPSAKRV